MSVAKVIEIMARSEKGFDDAIEQGLAKASDSVHNIKSAWVKDHEVVVSDGKITGWKVHLKVTFVLD
ncbi:MAG TPA: dodecin family protein [Acidimicrobiia bacterium]|nr:dodecin family protein [Acidimicrobiia bacterium]